MKLPEPGDVFEGYQIGEVLGFGGFARVFAATSIELGREVALKILVPKADGYDPRLEQRFLREAQAVAALEDPHTLDLFGYGRAANGLLYISFERLEGEDLATLLNRRGQLTEPEVVHIIRQVLMSLREAHGRGLLHRDIKPENVRVFAVRDDPMFVKVMDFGIAKSIVEPDTPLTRTGDIVGTPRYMAPEQLMDDPLSPAVDVFSVGLLAHDMLFGLESRGRPSVVGHEIGEAAPVSPHLRTVLNRAMVGIPEQRYGNALQMLRALDEPAIAPPPPHSAASVSAPLPVRRSPAPLVVLAIVCIALVAAVGVYLRSPKTGDAPSAPPGPRENPFGERPQLPKEPPPPIEHTDTEPEKAASTTNGACSGLAAFSGHTTVVQMDGLREVHWPIYVPPSYEPTRRHPLVLLIHDQFATPGEFIELKEIVKQADKHGYVLFAPEDDMIEPWLDKSDYDFIIEGLQSVSDALCLDPNEIYAIGHGRGSAVVEELSCRLDFAAIATTNYTDKLGNKGTRCVQPVRAIHLHGMSDPYHPGEGGKSCTGKVRESIAERDADRRAARQCSGPERTVLREGTSKCVTWPCRVDYVSCQLDGGHNWPRTGDRIIDIANCESEAANFPFAHTIFTFFRGRLD